MSDKSNFSINLVKISKSYSKKNVLHDIEIRFDSNQIYGLIGSNGAGKTTLLEIIVGLKSSDSGIIQFNSDQKIIGIPKDQIGFAGQIPVLWNKLSCTEHAWLHGRFYNIPKKLLQSRIENLFSDFEFEDYKNYKIENLSGGLKQRLNLTLSLLHSPRIIIWDEPTTGLDIDFKLLLRKFLLRYSEENNALTIISSHDLFELEQLCSKFIFLSRGKIIANGNFSQLEAEHLSSAKPNTNVHLEEIYKKLIHSNNHETHFSNL